MLGPSDEGNSSNSWNDTKFFIVLLLVHLNNAASSNSNSPGVPHAEMDVEICGYTIPKHTHNKLWDLSGRQTCCLSFVASV
ncbi:hypothetical protein CFP56_021848 [Quercus suber]|uniref:Secreted protein n=1 Tax=Quercus suber TaxID=58331 RepID=A0AAW0KEB4_QUESU